MFKQACQEAAQWPRQNHAVLLMLSGLGFYVFLNWVSFCLFAPQLLKMLFGIESVLSRSPVSMLNTTFFATMLGLTYLCVDPEKRVTREERAVNGRLRDSKSTFSASLMTHNTQVAVFALALGMTWGVGTIILLFYNGVILGAIALDYVRAGQTLSLLGWLLPHGAVEIPAILIAGQAGLVLAWALIGWGKRTPLRAVLLRESCSLNCWPARSSAVRPGSSTRWQSGRS